MVYDPDNTVIRPSITHFSTIVNNPDPQSLVVVRYVTLNILLMNVLFYYSRSVWGCVRFYQVKIYSQGFPRIFEWFRWFQKSKF